MAEEILFGLFGTLVVAVIGCYVYVHGQTKGTRKSLEKKIDNIVATNIKIIERLACVETELRFINGRGHAVQRREHPSPATR